jgi:hypothetical protein
MISGILLFAAYTVYALRKNSAGPQEIKFWAIAMLVFIGISVGAMIVIQVLFHIALAVGIAGKDALAAEREECDEKHVERLISSSMVEDEMDTLINLKSARVRDIFFGIGFMAALASLAFGASAVFALHFIFGAIAVGTIIEGGVSVYLYERGVRNG